MGNKSMKPSSTTADSASASSLVENAIASHPVVIFSKTYCPYCTTAKKSIVRAGASVAAFAPPKVYELNRMGALGSQVQAYLAKKTGRRTVPNVFIAGKSVGGGDETAQFERSGVLKQMLTQAPDRLAALTQPDQPQKQENHAASVADVVEDALRNHPVVVFSKSYCPYCVAAKKHIAAAAADLPAFDGPKVYELDHMGDAGRQIQDYLLEKTGRTTVPNVFIAGQTVGGADDVAELAGSGQLVPRIRQAVQPHAEEPVPAQNPAEQLVEDAIAGNHVVTFSKTYCSYCIRAKATLAQAGKEVEAPSPPKIFELDEMGALGEDVQQYLLEKTGQRTVPNIFIGRKHIGGSDDLSGYSARGELKHLLAQAPAQAQTERASTPTPRTKEIVFGAGCFWGVELAFQRVVGVVKTEVGYSNGKLPSVSYEAVCSGLTGSAEVVHVTYDPQQVSLADLLEVWESRHDPTSMNKQGNDVGTQYRSGVYYNDDEQKAEIERWRTDAMGRLSKPVVSEIAPVKNYCTAEGYHQKYLEMKGQSAKKGSTTRIRCYG